MNVTEIRRPANMEIFDNLYLENTASIFHLIPLNSESQCLYVADDSPQKFLQ